MNNGDRIQLDPDALTLRLSQIGQRAIKGVSAIIRDEAEKAAKLAISFAPVDEGDLESAIKVHYERDERNRLTAVVYVDFDVKTSDGQTVGDYAEWLHEGSYNLGPKSLAKRAAGNDVGPKYIERAIEERAPIIFARVRRFVQGKI